MKKNIMRVLTAVTAAIVISGTAAAGAGAADTGAESMVDIFGNELPTGDMTTMKKITFVIDGFEFTCPSEYTMMYAEEVGPVVYVADSFQLRTVVRDDSYEESLQDKEALTAKALAAGAEITKDVTEAVVNDRDMLYFRMNLEGDDMMVMYSASPEQDKSFGGLVAVQNPNLTEEEILGIFAEVMDTAVPTDKPNSAEDDIYDQLFAPEPIGEAKEESTLTLGQNEVTFCVAEDFYSEYTSDGDDYVTESFTRDTDYATADIFVYSENFGYENAKEYMNKLAGDYSDRVEKIEGEEIEVGEYTFYCFAIEYPLDEDIMQRVYAACDLKNGGIYVIEGCHINGEEPLTVDTFAKFMEIQ